MGSRCQNCAALYLPPRPLCPACFGDDLQWEQLSGKGELAAFTTIYFGPTAMVEAGYDRNNPYCSAIVRLEEGPAISALVTGLDLSHPEKIRIGTPVQLVPFSPEDGQEDRIFLAFAPRET